MDFNFETSFDDDLGTITVHAAGSVSTFYPATMYNSHGDPGDDAEGGDVSYDELTATNEDGEEIDFPGYLLDQLDDRAIEAAN